MYKSIHDIPIYNFTQCSLGNYSYMGFGLFKKKRFKKMQKDMEQFTEVDERASDYAVKMNWVDLMVIYDKFVRNAAFGTREQRDRILAIVGRLGLTLDVKENEKKIQNFVDLISSEKPEEKKKKQDPLDALDGHLTWIGIVLEMGYLDSKGISAKRFITLTKLAQQKASKTNSNG